MTARWVDADPVWRDGDHHPRFPEHVRGPGRAMGDVDLCYLGRGTDACAVCVLLVWAEST